MSADVQAIEVFRTARAVLHILAAALLFLVLASIDVTDAAEGTVWAWGANGSHMLCSGTDGDHFAPFEIQSLGANVIAVASGDHHTLALKADGTVWACGKGLAVGNGDESLAVSSPVQVFQDAVAIAAGRVHSLALKNDGTVWAWGDGRLLLGTGSDQNNGPAMVRDGNLNPFLNVAAIAAGGSHSLAIDIYGYVWAWGNNDAGQLGDGTIDPRLSPVPIEAPSVRPAFASLTAVAAGPFHSFAIRADGTAWAWGSDVHGALGIGGVEARHRTPAQITSLWPVKTVGAGFAAGGALQTGTVWTWGNLCCVPEFNSAVPVQKQNLTGVKMLAVGQQHFLALLDDGSVWGWGIHDSGQLGAGQLVADSWVSNFTVTPVRVHNLQNVTSIFAGNDNSFAIVPPPSGMTTDVCRLRDWACGPAPRRVPGRLILECDRPHCINVSPIPKNCGTSFPCPSCAASGLCPPIYQMSFAGLRDTWKVELRDAEGKPVVHRQVATRTGTVLSFRPSKERFIQGKIGDYILVFQMLEKGQVGKKYAVRTALKAERHPPQLAKSTSKK